MNKKTGFSLLLIGVLFALFLTTYGAVDIPIYKPTTSFYPGSVKNFFIDTDGRLHLINTSDVENIVDYQRKTSTTLDSVVNPTVSGQTHFVTDAGAIAYSNFQNGVEGLVIHIRSAAAVTYDIAGNDTITGSLTDIVTGVGDIVSLVLYSSTWYLLGYQDVSLDQNNGLTQTTTTLDSNATPTILGQTNFVTDDGAFVFTDFDDGVDGQLISIRSAAAVSYDFTSNTSMKGNLTDIVTGVNDVVTLRLQDTIWFLQSWTKSAIDNYGLTRTLTALDSSATPTVAGLSYFTTNLTPVAFTDFADGVEGQEITIINTLDSVTYTNGATLALGSADITADTNAVIKLVLNGSVWKLVSYINPNSDNN